ncbi:MAG: prenyltransferase [Caldilinea sp.]|nr:prenyltransferase [Caldilinea sp.]
MTNQATNTESTPSVLRRLRRESGRRLENTLLGAMIRVLRPDVALALTLPAVIGTAVGAWTLGAVNWITLAFALLAIFVSALGFQSLTAYQDYEQSRRPDAKPSTDLPGSPFALQQQGELQPSLLLNVGALLFAAATLCAFWLALLTGWPVLFFGAVSFLIMVGAVLPPVHFAYRGYGLGEAGIFVAFGPLALLTGYYAQTSQVSWLPVMAGMPIALLATLVVMSQNLATARRDWLIGKRTLPVMLGTARALDLNAALTFTAYAGILAVTILTRMPLWYLAGLATLPLAMGTYADIPRAEVTPERGYALRTAMVKAAFWTTVLCVAALFISRPG